LVVWLWTILFEGRKGEAYNVGSPYDLQIIDVAEMISGMFSPKVEIHVMKRPDPKMGYERYVPDVTKAERDLNLRADIPLRLAIEKTLAWNQNR
jgi:nucleoside-diphosphate-sugar epimerase